MNNPLPLMYDPEADALPSGQPIQAPYEVGTPKGKAPLQEQPEQDYGPNNEKLPKKLQLALQFVVTLFVNEAQRGRRDEVAKCRKARAFWKGLQYEYFNEADGSWHLPWELRNNEDTPADEEPRYSFVTNFYQAFGLSLMAVLSQDVPAVQCWPQSPSQPEDVDTAEGAQDVIELVERNNRIQEILLDETFYLFTDGVVGGYVRYVVDGQRFGYHEEPELEQRMVKLGEDAYQCPECGYDTPANGFMGVCAECGMELGEDNFHPAEAVQVPVVKDIVQMPNGQEVIDVVGGLELKRPPWARHQHQFPYLIWDFEAHRAKLRASFPHVRKQIAATAFHAEDATAVQERNARISLSEGGERTPDPIGGTGADLTNNLVTYRQAWLRPWAFYALDDDNTIKELEALFPHGCYVAFAGDVYCCSRNESMDDHWRVMHALPGDGQNRPGIGTSFISVQERINTLSNLEIETVEHGIPSTWANPAIVDFDAIRESYVEPGAIYPAAAPPGTKLQDAFFETAPARVSETVPRLLESLPGQVGQFLTGAFPALFGGEMDGNDTASGYSMARDQALGRIGLVFRNMKWFHAELMGLAVEVFRNNRTEDVEVPLFGEGRKAKSKWIALERMKGGFFTHAEVDTAYPELMAQKRARLDMLLQSPDPQIQAVLGRAENMDFIRRASGLTEIQIREVDSQNKQMEEIDDLLESAPMEEPGMMDPASGMIAPPVYHSTVPIDELLDDHKTEFETIQAWANSPAGRQAKATNPMGYYNVQAHALEHFQVVQQQMAAQAEAEAEAEGGDEGGAQPSSGGAE